MRNAGLYEAQTGIKAASAGDIRGAGLIPGSGRFPGGGHGNLLQYYCLKSPRRQRSLAGYTVHGVAKSCTQLND